MSQLLIFGMTPRRYNTARKQSKTHSCQTNNPRFRKYKFDLIKLSHFSNMYDLRVDIIITTHVYEFSSILILHYANKYDMSDKMVKKNKSVL